MTSWAIQKNRPTLLMSLQLPAIRLFTEQIFILLLC